ncbi:MAG: prepilin-type N-terminal cleavage/methylation domain-containing protein [Limisphaerales bacterium]
MRYPKRTAGFTFIEMMAALAISALLLAAVAMLTVFVGRSYAAVGNYVDLSKNSNNTVDILGREIRNSSALLAFSTNNPSYLELTNATTGTTITITYDANSKTLVLTKTGQAAQTDLTQCDEWNFALYSRAPDTNSFSTNILFFSAINSSGQLDPKDCKIINMTWKCSRTILGFKLNTEDVQTAQIVLRNKVD